MLVNLKKSAGEHDNLTLIRMAVKKSVAVRLADIFDSQRRLIGEREDGHLAVAIVGSSAPSLIRR
jgi:hypothetical protein